MRIAFLLPGTGIGGGTSVTLSHARAAIELGHAATIATSGKVSGTPRTSSGLAVMPLAEASRQPFDIAVATWWQEVARLHRLEARRRALFLQSMEDRFYLPGDPSASLVRETFSVPLPGVTIADWLRRQFRLEYGRDLPVVVNGIDKSVFSPDGPAKAPRRRDGLRVLVEGPLGVWFKSVVPALRLARSIADETWLLTSTPVGPIAGIDRVFSRCTPHEAAAVYRSCDVLLKLSLVEGLPLPPLEMFHCGGAVVAFDLPGVTEYAENGRNALVAPSGDYEAAGEHLRTLLRDRSLLERLRSGALATAQSWPDEREAGARFVATLESIVEHEPETDARTLGMLRALDRTTENATWQSLVRQRLHASTALRSLRHSIQVLAPGPVTQRKRR